LAKILEELLKAVPMGVKISFRILSKVFFEGSLSPDLPIGVVSPIPLELIRKTAES